jgi:hypothetical protein
VARRIGTSTAEWTSARARTRDTPILDLINEVQRKVTGAELSSTAAFSLTSRFPAGPVTVADVAGLYIYDNTLKSVRITGAQLRAYLEKSAVGIVFDVGGRGDKSFNDGAYLGAERAEIGVLLAASSAPRVRFIEPGEGSDREAGLRLLAAEGMDLVIGVGFIFTDDLTQLAKEYPNVNFAGVDYAVATDDKGQRHPAAAQPRRAQVPRGAGLVPRRRARRARRQVEEGRLRGRDGHPAHPQVRGGLPRGREAGVPRLHA